uniref:Uncharacterized protein n=1 Tax=Anguilla anguilla TaxID=7936 RepID=A0A0E9RUK6_ANGAN
MGYTHTNTLEIPKFIIIIHFRPWQIIRSHRT